MKFQTNIVLILVLVALFVLQAAAFVVPEGSQAIVLRFGAPSRSPITVAGLYFKMPFVERVRFLDRRVLNWDGEPNEVPTKDQKLVLIDATARWKIADPLLFIQTVIDERVAHSRISSVILAATRDTISAHDLVEAVRTNDEIFSVLHAQAESAAVKAGEPAVDQLNLLGVVDEGKLMQNLERVSVGREKLSEMIAQRARGDLQGFGIDLIDVQLMRVAYNPTVEAQVYSRMKAEQDQIAGKIRSLGRQEQEEIKGKLDRDLKEISSQAYRKVQEITGQADAEASRLYAEAIGSDTEFFRFLRTADMYRRGLRNDAQLILSAESDFLRLLRDGPPRAGKGQE